MFFSNVKIIYVVSDQDISFVNVKYLTAFQTESLELVNLISGSTALFTD